MDVPQKIGYIGQMTEYFNKEIDRLKRDYPDVLMDKIPEGHTMRAAPARIKFVTDHIKPLCVQKARRIPLHQEDEAKQITEDMVQRGIIVKQRASGYSRWCSPATFVPKKPTGLRLVTDYTHLNRFIDRPVHPFPTTEDIQRNTRFHWQRRTRH